MKELLFSVTKKDLKFDYFRGGGCGGQHKDKKDTCVRITHIPSGAVGEGRDERSREQNMRNAFKRMANSKKFQDWCKLQAYAIIYDETELEKKVDKMMADKNLRIEYGEDIK
jgi:peptide chain release factor 1